MSPARFREIADDLRRRIDDGEWSPGETISRQADLATEYGVARGTITEAIAELENEGRVLATRRKGTIVLERRVRRRITRGTHVHRRRPEGGYSFAATQPGEPTWQHHITPLFGVEPIPPRAAELLGVEPGTEVFRRRRVTSPAGETPFALSDSWIRPEIVDAAPRVAEQGVPGSWIDEIEAAGHGPLSWHEITRARLPTTEEARLLGIPPRLPVLEICRVSVSAATGEPADVTVMVIPSDRIETMVHLVRDATAIYEVLSPPGGPHSIKEA